MTKQELFERLCARPNVKRSPIGYLKYEYPKAYKSVVKKLGEEFDLAELYDFLQPAARRTCKTCGKGPVKFRKFNEGYVDYCGRSCMASSSEVITKKQKTCLERYGVTHQSKVEDIKKQKQQTCMRNHGVLHPMQSVLVRAKSIESIRRKYGVDNVQQHPAIFERAQRTRRRAERFVYGGKNFWVQGFEKFAYPYLHEECGIPVSLMSQRVANYKYDDPETNRRRYYIPDLFVACKTRNLVVEIKSDFTSGLKATGKILPNVKAKCKAVAREGDAMLLLVFDKHGDVSDYLFYDGREHTSWKLRQDTARLTKFFKSKTS